MTPEEFLRRSLIVSQGTLKLDYDLSEGSFALVIYEVVWPDNEPGFLFRVKEEADLCADRERHPIKGNVVNRYVF
jgi:hypothetical protein